MDTLITRDIIVKFGKIFCLLCIIIYLW